MGRAAATNGGKFVGYSNNHDVIRDVLKRFDTG
jgi:hypothetical protein